jgi:hypothetical protein
VPLDPDDSGIDRATKTHAVWVMNADGKIAAEFTIGHSADGIAMLIRRLARYGDPGDLPVAIERPEGCLVTRPGRCAPSCAPAPTWSRCGLRPPTR